MTFVLSVKIPADSSEHTFLECPINVKFYQEILSWLNAINRTFKKLSTEQFPFQNYPTPSINDNLGRQLDLLVLLIKKYLYSCKSREINPGCSQFINKLKIQWKIEISSRIDLSFLILCQQTLSYASPSCLFLLVIIFFLK